MVTDPGPLAPPPPPPSEVAGGAAASPTVSLRGAGRLVDAGRARVFPCDGCGASLEFHIGAQALQCPFCGHRRAIEIDPDRTVEERDLRATLEREAERRTERRGSDATADLHEVRCDDCGANVQFAGTLTSDDCPYCGTPIQRAKVHDASERIPVDGVLPFRVAYAAARERLAAWVRSRWFAPRDFLERGADGRFQGVYVPFWTYDAMTSSRYQGERGEHYWVTVQRGDKSERERRTRWYPASGSFRRFFDDVLVLAGQGLPKKLVDALDPWPLDGALPFTPAVLSGHLARTYDVPLADGLREAEQRIEAALREEALRHIGGDEQRLHRLDVEYGALTYKHLLLPVWLMGYRYRDRVYQVAVNAATGEVQGERPWSAWKIAGAVLAALAAGATAWFVFGAQP